MKKKNDRDRKCPKCKRILGGNWWYCDLCYDYTASETYAEKLSVLKKVEKMEMNLMKAKEKNKKCSKCKNIRGSNWFHCDYCWDYLGSKENGYSIEEKKVRKNKTRKQ